jgi:hypothetical protein
MIAPSQALASLTLVQVDDLIAALTIARERMLRHRPGVRCDLHRLAPVAFITLSLPPWAAPVAPPARSPFRSPK